VFFRIEKGNVLTVSATAAHTAIKVIVYKCGALKSINIVYRMGVC
jgi:hypothetical protein